MKKTLLLGMGNTIRGDDGAGILTARALKEQITHSSIDIRETQEAYICLLDIISDYEKVIIIDSIRTRKKKPGRIHRLTTSETDIKKGRKASLTDSSRNRFETGIGPLSFHQMGLASVVNMAEKLHIDIPEEIVIFAMEIENGKLFTDSLTPEAKSSIPELVDVIKEELSLSDAETPKEVQ